MSFYRAKLHTHSFFEAKTADYDVDHKDSAQVGETKSILSSSDLCKFLAGVVIVSTLAISIAALVLSINVSTNKSDGSNTKNNAVLVGNGPPNASVQQQGFNLYFDYSTLTLYALLNVTQTQACQYPRCHMGAVVLADNALWFPVNNAPVSSVFLLRWGGLSPYQNGSVWYFTNQTQSNAVFARQPVLTWGTLPNTTVQIVPGTTSRSDGYISSVPIKTLRLYATLQYSSQSTSGRMLANLLLNNTVVNGNWLMVGNNNNLRASTTVEWSNIPPNTLIHFNLGSATTAGPPTNAGCLAFVELDDYPKSPIFQKLASEVEFYDIGFNHTDI